MELRGSRSPFGALRARARHGNVHCTPPLQRSVTIATGPGNQEAPRLCPRAVGLSGAPLFSSLPAGFLFLPLFPFSPSPPPALQKSWREAPGTFGRSSFALPPRITSDCRRNPGTSRCCTTLLKSTTFWMTGTRCS